MKDRLLIRLSVAALMLPAFLAHAQTSSPLPAETRLVAATGAPAATEETFTIATAEDLTATFTDLQIPAALSSASVVVTQGAAIVGTAMLSSPATTATVSLPAAVGEYTLRVIGVPGAGNVGTFTVCVAPKASPTACIQDASISGNITLQSSAADPTVSTASSTVTVTSAGSYTFTYQDDLFPVALNVAPSLALFQGSTQVVVPLPASPATVSLQPGVYTLFGVAQADATAQAGLYGVTVTAPDGTAVLGAAFPVGKLNVASSVANATAQMLSLTVTDFGFPIGLTSASALVTSGGTALGSAMSGAGAVSISAPAATLSVWTYAAAGAGAGTYEIDLVAGTQSLLSLPVGVSNGSSLAYAYVSPTALTAGSYTASGSDFQFPAALQGLQFAVAQNAALIHTATAVGSFTFTASAAPVVLLVNPTTPTGGNGMFDVNVQTTGSTPQIVFDETQGASASGVFSTQTLTLPAGNFDATLSDLEFPAQFASLGLLISNNGAVIGKIFGGGTQTIAAAAGTYQLSFIAMPGGADGQYGIYGLQVVNSAPIVMLSASPTTVATGQSTTLTWTTTNATACTATGGAFTGSQSVGSGSASVVVSTTTTYTLTCAGAGGSGTQSVTVTATAATSSGGGGGGGGSLAPAALAGLALLAALRVGARSLHSRRRTLSR